MTAMKAPTMLTMMTHYDYGDDIDDNDVQQ